MNSGCKQCRKYNKGYGYRAFAVPYQRIKQMRSNNRWEKVQCVYIAADSTEEGQMKALQSNH